MCDIIPSHKSRREAQQKNMFSEFSMRPVVYRGLTTLGYQGSEEAVVRRQFICAERFSILVRDDISSNHVMSLVQCNVPKVLVVF